MSKSFYQIDGQTVPTDVATPDRAFREAWCLNNDAVIEVDMAEARRIVRDRLRNARVPVLEELDTYARRAQIHGAIAVPARLTGTGQDETWTAAEVDSRQQAFRDVTEDPRIEAVQSAQDLMALDIHGLPVSSRD